MDYELCKKLKERGFPQNPASYIFINGDELVHNTKESIVTVENSNIVRVPTLSELIEACGDVILWKHISGVWRADLFTDKYDGYIDESFDPSEGPTPEEAVVNLWLAIKSK